MRTIKARSRNETQVKIVSQSPAKFQNKRERRKGWLRLGVQVQQWLKPNAGKRKIKEGDGEHASECVAQCVGRLTFSVGGSNLTLGRVAFWSPMAGKERSIHKETTAECPFTAQRAREGIEFYQGQISFFKVS